MDTMLKALDDVIETEQRARRELLQRHMDIERDYYDDLAIRRQQP